MVLQPPRENESWPPPPTPPQPDRSSRRNTRHAGAPTQSGMRVLWLGLAASGNFHSCTTSGWSLTAEKPSILRHVPRSWRAQPCRWPTLSLIAEPAASALAAALPPGHHYARRSVAPTGKPQSGNGAAVRIMPGSSWACHLLRQSACWTLKRRRGRALQWTCGTS